MITIARSKAAHVALTLAKFADEFDSLGPLADALAVAMQRDYDCVHRIVTASFGARTGASLESAKRAADAMLLGE